MSMMRCDRHDQMWDCDWHECCPKCEALSIEVERCGGGFIAWFDADDPANPRRPIGEGATEDEAIDNLLMGA